MQTTKAEKILENLTATGNIVANILLFCYNISVNTICTALYNINCQILKIRLIRKKNMKVWIQAIRPFAFTATIIPVTVGAALAYYQNKPVQWMLFPIAMISALLYHAATNLVNEYFDFKKGVDRDDTYGSSRVLVDKLLSPKQVLAVGMVLFFIGTGLGLVLVFFRGWVLLLFGIAGFAGGYAYSGYPFGCKYKALGDIMVFILMGPLMVVGSFFVLTGQIGLSSFLVSIPIGILTTLILHANNTRDITTDERANISTFASLIGLRASKIWYCILLSVAYLSIVIMILFDVLPFLSLIVFLSSPFAVKDVFVMLKVNPNNLKKITSLDEKTARLHLVFGLLLVTSLFISG